MGNSNSKETPPPQISAERESKGLPQTLRIAYDKGFSLHVICLLSEPESDGPSFAVSLPDGIYGGMILHEGPTVENPALATVEKEGRRNADFAVNLPAISSTGVIARKEIVRHVLSVKKDNFWFGIRVGTGENRHSEKFEWRHSRGNEIRSMGQSTTGWKLVRLGSSRAEANDGQDAAAADRGEGYTKDGHEIVALWAHGKAFRSLKNMGEFQFRGSGASGELGLQWQIMALTSCLCIWLRTTQQATTTAAA